MPKLTYPEAVKAARTEKPRESYLTIQMDAHLVLTHKAGMQLLDALASAELLGRRWSSEAPLIPLKRDTVQVTPMSCKEYEQHKIAALMGVTVDDVIQAEQAAENPTP